MARIIAESAAASHPGRRPDLAWTQAGGHPWFEQELWLIRPSALICLGVTAASAVLRRRVTIRDERGQAPLSPQRIRTYVTEIPAENWGIGGVPAARARADEVEARRRAAAGG